jgi:transcriptional regulator with XRE-family HTH domain
MAQPVYDYLAGRRRLYDITQDVIAKRLDVSRQTVAAWEAGKIDLSLDQIRRWSGTLPLTEVEQGELSKLVERATVASWQTPAEGEG